MARLILGSRQAWLVSLALIGCGESARSPEGEGADDDAGAPLAPDAAEASDDLAWAPAALALDDGPAVAMDIVSLDGRIVFDLEQASASARAVLVFRIGDQDGRPVFDLRQTPRHAELDGEPLDLARLARRELSGPPGSEMRLVDAMLPARSEHTLVLEYRLETPDVLASGDVSPPLLSGGRVRWAFNLADYTAGHFLEQWLPANLIFDRHPLRLEIELLGSELPHALVTTGQVDELAPNHFEVRFPATTAAHSPLLVLRPEDELARRSARHQLPDGASLEVRTATLSSADVDLEAVEQLVVGALDDFVRSVGPYQHGDAFTLFVWDGYGMEYDGGASVPFDFDTGAASGAMNPMRRVVRHEVFHSWFGRGMQPVGQDHGWIDEAWNMYLNDLTEGGAPPGAWPLAEGFASQLVGQGPYDRDMVHTSDPYSTGPLVFAAIADRSGVQPLTQQMRAFYLAHRQQRYDTAMLERALYCATRDAAIRDIFHRNVYGKAGSAPELDDASYCAPAAPAPSSEP